MDIVAAASARSQRQNDTALGSKADSRKATRGSEFAQRVLKAATQVASIATGQGPHCIAAALALGDEPAQRSGPTRCLRFHLTLDESQQISVDALRIDDCYTVSAAGVDLEDRMRNDRGHAARGRADRHDLIVFAMQDQ